MTPEVELATTQSRHTEATSIDDQALVARIQGGERHLFSTIIRRYNQRLFRIARSILPDNSLAEDAVQEAYVAAFYALEDYQPRGSFAAWLSQIVINEARMIRRKRNRRSESSLNELESDQGNDETPPNMNPASGVANQKLAKLIEAEITLLPEAFRLVFVLRGVQQLSIADTAATLQISPATVKTRYHRARNMMQKALSPYIEEAGMSVYEFAGQRCDDMVAAVLRRLQIED